MSIRTTAGNFAFLPEEQNHPSRKMKMIPPEEQNPFFQKDENDPSRRTKFILSEEQNPSLWKNEINTQDK